jgi:cytochrome c oxidase assembly protein subunit 11
MLLLSLQCFCFEEQRIQPHEVIDMPVLFFIDKDFLSDPTLSQIDTVTLSYTFFKAGEEDQSFVEGNAGEWCVCCFI